MKFILSISLLLIAFSCSNRKNTSLDQYVIKLDEGSNINVQSFGGKCDTLLKTSSAHHPFLAVVTSDSIPVWTDPLGKNIAGHLHFADTIRVTMEMAFSCSPSTSVYKYYHSSQGKSYWASAKSVIRLSGEASEPASIYYIAAQDQSGIDSTIARRFINYVRKKFPLDTIHIESYYGNTSFPPQYAITWFNALLSGYHGQLYQQLKEYQKLMALPVSKELRNNAAYQTITSVNQLLAENSSKARVTEYLRLLHKIITEYKNESISYDEGGAWIDQYACDIIVLHFNKLAAASSESAIIDSLLHSGNPAVIMKGLQLRTSQLIQKGDYDKTLNTLLFYWRMYPDIKIESFEEGQQYISLNPTSIALDNLLSKTRDYKKVISFIQDMQKELTEKDSTLNGYLNAKTTQLRLGSNELINKDNFHTLPVFNERNAVTIENFITNYHSISEQLKLSPLIQNKVIVKSGTRIFDNLNVRNITITDSDLQGEILYESTNNQDGYTAIKIQTEKAIFWTYKNSVSQAPRSLFLNSPVSSTNKPFVSELLPLFQHYKYQFDDLNNDGVADLIAKGAIECVINGATMQTMWKRGVEYRDEIIFRKNDFFAWSGNGLSRISYANNSIWVNSQSFHRFGRWWPSVFGNSPFLYAFTTQGYVLEFDEFNGELKNTFRIGNNIGAHPIADGQNCIFISRDTAGAECSTLHSLNLKNRTFNWQLPLTLDYQSFIVNYKKELFITNLNRILSIDNTNGDTVNLYVFQDYIRNFTVSDNQLIAKSDRHLESINRKNSRSSDFNWIRADGLLYTNVLQRGNVIYACTDKELLFISSKNGQLIEKLTLPTKVLYLSELTIHRNKLLIPGEKYLMIVENIY